MNLRQIYFHWLLVLFPIIAKGQLYIGLNAGYHLPVAPQNLLSNSSIGISESDQHAVIGSLGQGIHANGWIGIIRNKNLAFELNALYQTSKSFSGSFIKDTSYQQNTKISGQVLNLAPVIRISIAETPWFFKVGPICREAGDIKVHYETTEGMGSIVTKERWKYTRGFSMGAFASVGRTIKSSEHWSFTAELCLMSQSWAPGRGRAVEYSINGVNTISTLNPIEKEIQFEKEVQIQYKSRSEWESVKKLKQTFPFSSIGIRLGFNFEFKHKEKNSGVEN